MLQTITSATKRLNRIRRNRDHTNGTDAVKDAGERYLSCPGQRDDPSAPGCMTAKDYEAHKLRTEYFPAAAKTLQSFTGLLFRKEPKLSAPDAFTALRDIITADGQSIEEAARWCFREYAVTNSGGILVDHPVMPEPHPR